jgi:hypothetical protein
MIPETELKLRDKIAELREALERENNRVKELEDDILAEHDLNGSIRMKLQIATERIRMLESQSAMAQRVKELESQQSAGDWLADEQIGKLKAERDQLYVRVKELEAENVNLERRFQRAASDASETKLEAPMTHQYEIVKGFNGLLAWGNRVAAEYGIVGTQDNFAFIERMLKKQHERITELEADFAAQAKLFRDQCELNYTLMNQNAALVSQSASGQGVRMEYDVVYYDSLPAMKEDLPNRKKEGWQVHTFKPEAGNENLGYADVLWRRPTRSETLTGRERGVPHGKE